MEIHIKNEAEMSETWYDVGHLWQLKINHYFITLLANTEYDRNFLIWIARHTPAIIPSTVAFERPCVTFFVQFIWKWPSSAPKRNALLQRQLTFLTAVRLLRLRILSGNIFEKTGLSRITRTPEQVMRVRNAGLKPPERSARKHELNFLCKNWQCWKN